jgi:hypothetical protein
LKWVWKSKVPPVVRYGQRSNFWMQKCSPGWNLLASLWSLWRKCYERWSGEKMVQDVQWRKDEFPRWWSKWPPVVSHYRSAWPDEWEDSRKQKIHLFLRLKRFLAAERFSSDDEVKTAMQHWVKTLAADFFDEGIQKIVPRYDRCLNLCGDYVEK